MPSAFWLQNVLCVTVACNFWSLVRPDGFAPAALASLLFDPLGPQNIGKTVFRDFPTIFARLHFFFLLALSLFWSSFFFLSLLWLFPPLLFYLSMLSEVWLLNFLRPSDDPTLGWKHSWMLRSIWTKPVVHDKSSNLSYSHSGVIKLWVIEAGPILERWIWLLGTSMIDQSQSLRQTQVYQLFHGSANPTGNPTQKAQNSSWSLASPGLPIAFGFSENRVSRNLMINHHCPYLFGSIQGYTPFSDPFVVFCFKTHSLRSARNSGDTGEVCSEIGKLGWWRLCRPSVCALLVFQTHGYKNQQKRDVKTHYFMDACGGMKRARIPRIHTLRNIHFFLSLLSSCTTLYKLSTSTSNRFIRAATSFSLLATFFWLPKESRPTGLQHASSLSKSHALTCVIRFFWLFYHQAWSHWHFCWFAHCHFRVRSCCAKLWPSVSEYLKMETESHQIVFLVKLVPLGISVVSIKSTLHWSMLILSPHWLRFNDPRDISFYKASGLSKGREASKRWQQQSFRDD